MDHIDAIVQVTFGSNPDISPEQLAAIANALRLQSNSCGFNPSGIRNWRFDEKF